MVFEQGWVVLAESSDSSPRSGPPLAIGFVGS